MSQKERAMGRREFLRIATGTVVVGVAAGAEKKWGWVEDALGILTNLTVEGNVFQRKSIFERIVLEAVAYPSNENREVVVAWLKANLLEFYCRAKGWEMAATGVRHFLYGGGRPLDIGDLYKKSLLELEQPMEPGVFFGEKLVEKMEQLSQIPDVYQWTWGERIQRGTFLKGFQESEGTVPRPFSFKFTIGPESDDQAYFLNNHNVEMGGVLMKLEKGDDFDLARIRLQMVDLTDAYNWHSEVVHKRSLGGMVSGFLSRIGVDDGQERLRKILGEEMYTKFIGAELSFADEEMVLLRDKGWASEYEIGARFEMDREVDVRFPKQFTQ